MENINDENIGKKILIEKHLRHRRHREGSGSFLSGKNSRDRGSEVEKCHSVQNCSDIFDTDKDISEIYDLDGTLNLPRNTAITNREGRTKLSSKELRKLKQEKFYLDQLEILRDAQRRLKLSTGCNMAPITRRIIDNFNQAVVGLVGCRTYTGPVSQTQYEAHLVGELCKLRSVCHVSYCELGEVRRTRPGQQAGPHKLILPDILNKSLTAGSGELVEVRGGGVRQVIRLPRNKSEQQISFTFTIPSLQSRSGF